MTVAALTPLEHGSLSRLLQVVARAIHAAPGSGLWAVALAVGLTGAAIAGVWVRSQRARPGRLPWLLREVRVDGAGQGMPYFRDPVRRVGGRPDLLVRRWFSRRRAPVEAKPLVRARRVRPEDRVQLGVQLVAQRAAEPAEFAGHGYVLYGSGTFRISLTPALEADVDTAAARIRALRLAPVPDRSHADPARCAACEFHSRCDQSLAAGRRHKDHRPSVLARLASALGFPGR